MHVVVVENRCDLTHVPFVELSCVVAVAIALVGLVVLDLLVELTIAGLLLAVALDFVIVI